MSRRIDLPSALVLLGAGLLLVSLFVSWFADSNAWEAFEALDLMLLALAGAAALAALGRLSRDADDARPALVLGLAALVIVVVQLLEPPPGFGDDETEAGVWMALVASLLMTVGAGLALASINVVVDVSARERRRRVPAVDKREKPADVRSARIPDAPADDANSLFREGRGGGAERLPTPEAIDDEDDRTQPMRVSPPDDDEPR